MSNANQPASQSREERLRERRARREAADGGGAPAPLRANTTPVRLTDQDRAQLSQTRQQRDRERERERLERERRRKERQQRRNSGDTITSTADDHSVRSRHRRTVKDDTATIASGASSVGTSGPPVSTSEDRAHRYAQRRRERDVAGPPTSISAGDRRAPYSRTQRRGNGEGEDDDNASSYTSSSGRYLGRRNTHDDDATTTSRRSARAEDTNEDSRRGPRTATDRRSRINDDDTAYSSQRGTVERPRRRHTNDHLANGTGGGSNASLSHEEEIERIRELRERRLRGERRTAGDSDAPRRAHTAAGNESSDRADRYSTRRERTKPHDASSSVARARSRDRLAGADSNERARSRDRLSATTGREDRARSRDRLLSDRERTRVNRRERTDADDHSPSERGNRRPTRERDRGAGRTNGRSSSVDNLDSFPDINEQPRSSSARDLTQRRSRRNVASESGGHDDNLSASSEHRLRPRESDRPLSLRSVGTVSSIGSRDSTATGRDQSDRYLSIRSITSEGDKTESGTTPADEVDRAPLTTVLSDDREDDRNRSKSRDANNKSSNTAHLEERETRRRQHRATKSMPSAEIIDPTAGKSSELARLRERREAQRAVLREQRATGTKSTNPAAERRAKVEEIRAQNASLRNPSGATEPSQKAPDGSRVAESADSPTNDNGLSSLEFSDVDDDPMPGGVDRSGWSVRVCVVSAVDLPIHVVPNMPLCPVIKFGLLKLPQADASMSPDGQNKAVLQKLGSSSISRLKTARVRSTTSKILSKRDNGSVDFHQELRWDSVKYPMSTALCIEICAQAVRLPTNFQESPYAIEQDEGFQSLEQPSQAKPTSNMKRSKSADGMLGMDDYDRGVSRNASGGSDDEVNPAGGLRALWRKATNRKAAELEAANAAAAVARMLVEQDKGPKAQGGNSGGDPIATASAGELSSIIPASSQRPDFNVALQHVQKSKSVSMTEDMRLGSLVVPLTSLPLGMAMDANQTARVEQWYQLETLEEFDVPSASTVQKKPRVLLEISFSSPDNLDDSEDEMEDYHLEDLHASDASFNASKTLAMMHASFSRRASIDALGLRQEEKKPEGKKVDDPVLKAGVVDFISVIGAKDLGNLKDDDGKNGWVESAPKCGILEQFPPSDEFYQKIGRSATLQNMTEWFSFPEGLKMWRGTAPPTHSDLNLKRFSASSPPNVDSSIAAFDACLNCTTSFAWFVVASNSDEYGSSLVKTYGAVIRFYVPVPVGIDPAQPGFGRTLAECLKSSSSRSTSKERRLWVPMGICLTANLPIVGVLEAMLLRLCEELVKTVTDKPDQPPDLSEIHKQLTKLILNFQKPIPGAVNCSVPFLKGERFLLSLPPLNGLPPLPHGNAIISVCRLLGAEGMIFMLTAVLTECKILLHAHDVADISLVAEVVTALCYPFSWSLPFIPILPLDMLEFVEAPLAYFLGVPTSSMKFIDSSSLEDVVVVDLDNGFSTSSILDTKRRGNSFKNPTPLPASVATSVSKSVYKLLRAEEQVEEEFGNNMDYDDLQMMPRLATESLAEREFRIAIAVQICGLLRGYQECTGPVFNRDKFLKIAPGLYEERKDSVGVGSTLSSVRGNSSQNVQKFLSPRSKRFLSTLVSGQNFQQLLDILEAENLGFFHEVMGSFDDTDKQPMRSMDSAATKLERTMAQLNKAIQKIEDKIPTYRVDTNRELDADDDGFLFEEEDQDFQDIGDFDTFQSSFRALSENTNAQNDQAAAVSFTERILKRPALPKPPQDLGDEDAVAVFEESCSALLKEQPWEYQHLFAIPLDESQDVTEKVKLKDAIGERRYRAWKLARDQKLEGLNEFDKVIVDDFAAGKQGTSLDLSSLVTSATSDMSESTSSIGSIQRESNLTTEQQKVADAKSRDIIRRCLDKAQGGNRSYGNEGSEDEDPFVENGRNLMAESEKALIHPSAQRFLLSILRQRSRLQNERGRSNRRDSSIASQSVSRLESLAFGCLIRLSCAMLDSCMEHKDYEPAYQLLTYTAGFIMIVEEENEADESEHEAMTRHVITMISRIGLHPIFADIGIWMKVMALHLKDRRSERRTEAGDDTEDEESDAIEYDSAVATLYEMLGYGIPGEELSKFALRTSEEHGWFCDERGKQLLMLARRISVRREQNQTNVAGGGDDIAMIRKGQEGGHLRSLSHEKVDFSGAFHTWVEVGWCHPAAPSKTANGMGSYSSVDTSTMSEETKYMKRSPVTALSSFSSSVVISGGLDGSVFLAHTISEPASDQEDASVRGIHLDWGSASRAGAGSTSDGVYGVGAVSCLAACVGPINFANKATSPPTKDSLDNSLDKFDSNFIDSMEGSRVVAGTTAGDLRVWSVKDVYTAVAMATNDESTMDLSGTGMPTAAFGGTSAANRLKFSLRGRALSGHRGGVTCIDVPPALYRPDSLITGGADGLIKLWSLRSPTGGRRNANTNTSESDNASQGTSTSSQQRGRGGDALSVLNGHKGRVLCLQTAWHGDRLLSGGADRTLRIWDLTNQAGKPIHTLTGHFGWVTKVRYWGPNTIVSASTDRSVSLWDARVQNSPLFVLRHHQSPVSDILVGSRTDPLMTSASADGSIATWDFRSLSGGASTSPSAKEAEKQCQIVRSPAATMLHRKKHNEAIGMAAQSVFLAPGIVSRGSTILSVGPDAIVKEWDHTSGQLIEDTATGHCDVISSFRSFGPDDESLTRSTATSALDSSNAAPMEGTITSSCDGTIRMRRLIREM